MGLRNQKSITKGILYYAGEILVVIIGILVAFQLNNLKEKNKNAEEEIQSLKRISADLQIEQLMLNGYKVKLDYSSNYLMEVIYDKKRENLDSLYYHLSQVFIHYKMNSEYINLKYSGRLNLIKNDTLRYNLVRFYEVYYTFYDELSESHKNYVEEYVDKFFLNEFPSDTTYLIDPSLVVSKLEDEKFRNILINQLSFYRSLRERINVEEVEILNDLVRNEFD